MSTYDLESLNLPRLYGFALDTFAKVLDNPLGRSLAINNLLESGGIPKFRQLKLSEPPTPYPLLPVPEPARELVDFQSVEADLTDAYPYLPYPTIRDYADAYRQGKTDPVQVAEKILEMIAESEHKAIPMHAFTHTDPSDLMVQAQASQQRFQAGQPISLLDGVPIAVKDEVDQVPFPTNVGTTFLGSQPAQADATAVARLRALGALLIGKTTMHEIGINPNGENTHYGRVANPFDLRRDTGGSSCGSAAAVAAGLCPAALGADGGGSIRIPAALCGVLGLKPTFGRVSEFGAAPLCPSVTHLGPLGASTSDIALMYAAISGPDPRDANSQAQPPLVFDGWNTGELRRVRAGICWDWFRHADTEVVNANQALLDRLVQCGLEWEEIDVPDLDAMRVAHAVSILTDMAASMKPYESHFQEFSPSTRITLTLGKVLTSKDYLLAQRVRTHAMQIFDEIFQRVDLIITPATALPAPIVPEKALSRGWSDLNIDTEMMRYVFPANLTGHPAISIPAGYTRDGMPIGMQAIARHWEEHLLLRLAYTAEQLVQRRLPENYYPILEL